MSNKDKNVSPFGKNETYKTNSSNKEINDGSKDKSAEEFVDTGVRKHKDQTEVPENAAENDDDLKEKLLSALQNVTRLDASEVKMSVHNGNVTLQGKVQRKDDVSLAEETIGAQEGVHKIENHLEVVENSEGQKP